MQETFITKIHVEQSRNIRDLTISLSEEQRQHLIITGKNGSGKTSLLNDLFECKNKTFGLYATNINSGSTIRTICAFHFDISVNFGDKTYMSEKLLGKKDFLFIFFNVNRQNTFKKPLGISKVNLPENPNNTNINNVNQDFVQYS